VMKEIRRKWFILVGNLLYILKSPQDTKPKCIPLEKSSVVVQKISKNTTEKSCFELVTPERVLVLYADSSSELHEWMNLLQSKSSSRSTIRDKVDPTTVGFASGPPTQFLVEKKNVKQERQQELELLICQYPDLFHLLIDPSYQPVYSQQHRNYVEGIGNMTAQGIVDYWLKTKYRKDEMEVELAANISSLLPLIANEKLYVDFQSAIQGYMAEGEQNNGIDSLSPPTTLVQKLQTYLPPTELLFDIV